MDINNNPWPHSGVWKYKLQWCYCAWQVGDNQWWLIPFLSTICKSLKEEKNGKHSLCFQNEDNWSNIFDQGLKIQMPMGSGK